MWRKICHVEKFQIYMHDRCGEIWNFSTFGVISNFSTWQMWRNLTFLHMLSNFKFFHMTDVEKSEVSPHLASVWCEECLNICERYALLLKNWFYAVLSRNLFCRDLRTFVWRKIESKIASVEKKWQISGMGDTLHQNCKTYLCHKVFTVRQTHTWYLSFFLHIRTFGLNFSPHKFEQKRHEFP